MISHKTATVNRSISADLIKALSIFGVVFIHGSSGILTDGSVFSEYLSTLFRFSVPCFIILWAYFFEISYSKKDKIERKRYIKERFIHLFTIYIIWSLIYFLILVDWQEITIKKTITAHFLGAGFSGQYFFIILFQLLLLYPIIRYIYSKKALRNITLILIVFIYILYGYYESFLPEFFTKIGYRFFLFWIPYVFLGISLIQKQTLKLPIIFSMAVFLILIEFFLLKKLNLSHSAYITPMILLGSILFCSSLLLKKINIKNKYLSNTISYIGKNTMTIFVANPLVILLLNHFITKKIFDNTTLLEIIIIPFLSSFIILLFCILIQVIIKKIKLNGVIN